MDFMLETGSGPRGRSDDGPDTGAAPTVDTHEGSNHGGPSELRRALAAALWTLIAVGG